MYRSRRLNGNLSSEVRLVVFVGRRTVGANVAPEPARPDWGASLLLDIAVRPRTYFLRTMCTGSGSFHEAGALQRQTIVRNSLTPLDLATAQAFRSPRRPLRAGGAHGMRRSLHCVLCPYRRSPRPRMTVSLLARPPRLPAIRSSRTLSTASRACDECDCVTIPYRHEQPAHESSICTFVANGPNYIRQVRFYRLSVCLPACLPVR